MCMLDGMKVCQKALPLPKPFDEMWKCVTKITIVKVDDCIQSFSPETLGQPRPGQHTVYHFHESPVHYLNFAPCS